MKASYFGVAGLTTDQLQQLQALEQELGTTVIALKPTVPLADLTEDQLARLQALEKELNVVMLACKPD